MLAVVLLGWALTVNYPKLVVRLLLATHPPTTVSATAWPTTATSSSGARIWCACGASSRAGPRASSSSAAPTPTLRLDGTAPFLHVDVRPDADPIRLYFAKSFLYPLFAAPFIWLAGTNGFLVLHVLVVLATFLCAYAFLAARSQPVAALLFAGAFVFVSVVPVYLVWLTPDCSTSGW